MITAENCNSLTAASNVLPAGVIVELNERNIKTAAVGETLWDSTIKGLHLRVFDSRRSFYLFYRPKTGGQRKPKIGDHGSITLAQARKVAREMLVEVAAGGDPAADRAEARAEPTVADLWAEYWKRKAAKKKSSINDDRHWRLHIEPRFGRMKVKDVTYAMVDDLHKEMADTPTEANRVLATLSTMFNFAHRPLEWIERNPAHGVERNKERKRKRYMKGEEAAKIAEILHREAKDSPASVAFLYLLILTGARRGEIAKAKWSDLHGNRLVLGEHKTDHTGDERYIYLPPAAMEVLERLPRTSGTITGILTPQKLWERIRIEADCPDLRMHDLRHSFASAAIAAGLSLAQIGELLGHRSTQTTKRYAHLVEEAATAAAGLAADRIMLQMKKAPVKAGANPEEVGVK